MHRILVSALLASAALQALALDLPPAPIARNDSYELNGLTLDVSAPGILANDTGTGVSVATFGPPASGALSALFTNGVFQYTPAYGFAGVTSFNYSITDAYGRSSSATVSIDASTSLPKARDDYYTPNGTTLSISAPGLLANDTGGIGERTLATFTPATSGVIEGLFTNGALQYRPAYGFAGMASFSYTMVDQLGRSAGANVYIDMGASIPVAFDDSFTVLSGGTLDILAPGLLANDQGGIGELSVASFAPATVGVVESLYTNGTFRYRADPGFVGTSTFSYSAIDELGRSSLAQVTIHVTAVPEPSAWLMGLAGLTVVGVAGVSARRRT